MELADRVKLKRKELGLTQDELAKRMGYKSRVSVNKIEMGRPISQKIIVRLAEALNTTPSYLMGWTNEEPNENTYSEIGNRLKDIRESRNISTEEIAMEFNISVEDVLNYENGLKEIPIEYLKMFATYFNVSVDELISFDVNNRRTVFITKDEKLSERYRKWQKAIGYDLELTDEEIDEIIDFAKYVISKRKD